MDFELHGEPVNAAPMAAYMKNQFPFLGVKTPARKAQSAALLKASLAEAPATVHAWIQALYARPAREYQYVAIALASRNVKRWQLADMQAILPLITTKPWWDSVDSWRMVYGQYIGLHPAALPQVFAWFATSDDHWLRRVGITLQLMQKDATDVALLQQAIERDLQTPDFFIQKAIGWALRQYSKTNPAWVAAFLARPGLSALARREGSKYLNKQS